MFDISKVKKLNYALIFENVFLVMMACMIMYYFLGKTTFVVPWPDDFLLHFRNVVTAVVVLRMVTKKNYDIKKILFMGIVLLAFYIAYINDHSNSQIVDVVLLMIGSYDIRIDKIAKTYSVTMLLLLLVTIISSLAGVITNQSSAGGTNVYVNYCLGSKDAFWISASVFYLTCAYLLIRLEKIKVVELLLLEIVNLAFFTITNNLNHAICITVIILCVSFAKDMDAGKLVGEAAMLLGCIIPLISALGSILFIVYADLANPTIAKLNEWLGNRLTMCRQGYDTIGLSFWGKKIVTYGTSYGSKVTQNRNDLVIDSGYLYMAIKYGIVVFLVFLALLLWMNYQACLTKQKILLIICCVNAVQFIFARDMFFVNCNFLILCAFAAFEEKTEASVELPDKKDDGNSTLP